MPSMAQNRRNRRAVSWLTRCPSWTLIGASSRRSPDSASACSPCCSACSWAGVSAAVGLAGCLGLVVFLAGAFFAAVFLVAGFLVAGFFAAAASRRRFSSSAALSASVPR